MAQPCTSLARAQDRIEDAMQKVRAEEEARDMRNRMNAMRLFIAYALCHECGEELGEDLQQITQDQGEDGPRTVHIHCARD